MFDGRTDDMLGIHPCALTRAKCDTIDVPQQNENQNIRFLGPFKCTFKCTLKQTFYLELCFKPGHSAGVLFEMVTHLKFNS